MQSKDFKSNIQEGAEQKYTRVFIIWKSLEIKIRMYRIDNYFKSRSTTK